MKFYKILVLMVAVGLVAVTSPLLAKLPSYFEEVDELTKPITVHQGTVSVPLHNPFYDMSDREYLHLTEQGPYSKPLK